MLHFVSSPFSGNVQIIFRNRVKIKSRVAAIRSQILPRNATKFKCIGPSVILVLCHLTYHDTTYRMYIAIREVMERGSFSIANAV